MKNFQASYGHSLYLTSTLTPEMLDISVLEGIHEAFPYVIFMFSM